MIIFGEAGIVKVNKIGTPKLADYGKTYMLAGYNMNSGKRVLRMWIPKTNRIHRTRDINWLDVINFKPSTTKDRESIKHKSI